MDHIFSLLHDYGYYVLFPLAVVEGPILAVIAGFLCATGIMNPFLVYLFIVSGDIVGDSVCYFAGRSGKSGWLNRVARWFGVRDDKVERLKSVFQENPVKTVALSKVALGIGVVGIYLAGLTRIPYRKFILTCLVTSGLQYIVYITIGVLFGSAYQRISHYLNVTAAVLIVAGLAILAYFVINNLRKKL